MANENLKSIIQDETVSAILVEGKTSVFASFPVSKWSPYFSQSLESQRTDNLLFVFRDGYFCFTLSMCSENNINSVIYFHSLTI